MLVLSSRKGLSYTMVRKSISIRVDFNSSLGGFLGLRASCKGNKRRWKEDIIKVYYSRMLRELFPIAAS